MLLDVGIDTVQGWLYARSMPPEELAHMQELFGLHELAVEDAQSFHLRQKVEQYEEGIQFVVLRTARYVDELPNQEVPAYTALDVRVAWKPSSRLDVAIIGRDLLDPRHAEFGLPATRRSVTGAPRAPLCGMGICYECRVTIDGTPHRLSCQTLCADGMEVVAG